MLSLLLASSLYYSCKKEPDTPSAEEVQREMFARVDDAYNRYVQQLEADGVVLERSCGTSAQVRVIISSGSSPLAVTVRNSCGTLIGSYTAAGTYYVCAAPGETLTMAGTGNPGTSFNVTFNRFNWCSSCPGAPAKCIGPNTVIAVTTPNSPPYIPTLGSYNVSGCNYECE